MAWVFWGLVIASVGASVALAVGSRAGQRALLLGPLVLGLTPLGLIAGPGVPVYVPEILLLAAVLVSIVTFRSGLGRAAVSLPVALVTFYFAAQAVAFLGSRDANLFDFVRDLRPILFMLLLAVLAAVLKANAWLLRVDERRLRQVVGLFLLCDVLYYAAALQGWLPIGGISGEFYARTGVVRYADATTLTLFGVASYLVFAADDPRNGRFWLFVCGFIALTSLNRVYGFGFVVAGMFWLYQVSLGASRSRAVSMAVAVLPAVVIAAGGFWYVQSQTEAGETAMRVVELFSLELLLGALEYRFVEPALVGGWEGSLATILFGEGMGFRFYVPWFEYRGLDPWHFSVDSLFALGFFKYGVVGLTILLTIVFSILLFSPLHIANLWVWLYLVVHSGINVPSFLLFLVVIVLLRHCTWISSEERLRSRRWQEARPLEVDDDKGMPATS